MLKGKKVFLRALEPGDVDKLYQWENEPEAWRVSETITPLSRHILEKYVNSVQDIYAEKQLRLIIVANKNKKQTHRNEAVGCIDLFDFDPKNLRAGIGILIAEKEHRRKGYAEDALALVIQYAHEPLGLHQLYCNIPADNKASLSLFQKSKFIKTGYKKEWIRRGNFWVDEYFLQLLALHK